MVSFDSRWESNHQFYIGVFGSRNELLDSETVRHGRSVVFEIYNRKSKSCSLTTSIAVVEYNLLVAPITTVSSSSLVRSVFVGVTDIGVQVINLNVSRMIELLYRNIGFVPFEKPVWWIIDYILPNTYFLTLPITHI